MILIILGRALQFLLALAMVKVATTLLSPAEMGRVSLILTTTAFFALFLVNPVGMFINRRLLAWYDRGITQSYFTHYIWYLLAVACSAFIILLLLASVNILSADISIYWLVILVCGSLIFNTINQTAIPSLNLLGDSRSFITLTLATLLASFAFATLLTQLIKPTAYYWLLGILIGQALLAIVGTLTFFTSLGKKSKDIANFNIHHHHYRALFKFAWPVAIAVGLGWVQSQSYRYLMEYQLGLAQLGLFVAGYGISAGIIAGVESVLTAYFQPRLYREVNNSDLMLQAIAWQRYAEALTPSLLLAVAYVGVTAPELTKVFLGESFQSAYEYVLWGAFAEATRVLIGMYSLIAHIRMRTNSLILPNLVGAISSICLSIILIPKFGASGAGISLTISGALILITMHYWLSRYVKIKINYQSLLKIALWACVLLVININLKNTFNTESWSQFSCVFLSTSSIFLVMQYFLMRKYLFENRA